MAKKKSVSRSSNFILSSLSAGDFDLLGPQLEQIDLPVRLNLEHRKKPLDFVYFLNSGVASVVANGSKEIEVGIVGREGMTGVSLLLGVDTPAAYHTYIQVAGSGQRLPKDVLRAAIKHSATLQADLLRYAYSFLTQITQTALANGRASLDQRLSRWLLMVNDRVDGDVVPLTHEFLAVMLGVNRPGVTLALQELERTGTITQRRGSILIVDREALEGIAGVAYVKAE